MKRNVIVFGATGKTGKQLCKELESENIKYSVFVREASSKKLSADPAKIIVGDVLNSRDVDRALGEEDFTDVIIALGSKDLKNSKIRSTGTRFIVDTLNQKQNNTTSIHVVSALGVGDSWSQLNWLGKLICRLLLKNTMSDHSEQESVVINSQYPFHIIRPVGLKDGEASGTVHIQNKGIMPSNSIQRADVARFLVKSLMENKRGISGICQKV